MLAVKLADVGIGAVVGAIISGAVLLMLDQRRRSWERKNRWKEDKRRTYARFLDLVDLLFEQVQLSATVMPALNRLGEEGKDASPAELKLIDQLEMSFGRNMPKLQEHLLNAGTELSLIASEPSVQAGRKMVDIINRVSDTRDGDREVLSNLEIEYKRARTAFRAEARRDLGVST